MPVVIITRSPVLPFDHRDELARRTNLVGDPPEGLIFHVRSEVTDDTQLSVQLWESPEFHERYVNDRMLPAARGIADELGLPDQVVAETLTTLTTLTVTQPGLAKTVVDDFGNEVRTVSAR